MIQSTEESTEGLRRRLENEAASIRRRAEEDAPAVRAGAEAEAQKIRERADRQATDLRVASDRLRWVSGSGGGGTEDGKFTHSRETQAALLLSRDRQVS